MSADLLIGLTAGAIAAALVAYALIRALLRAHAGIAATDAARPVLNQLLAFFAGVVERRRGLDAGLDKRLSELETLTRQAGGTFLGGATGAEIFVARWVFPILSTLVLATILPLLGAPAGLTFLAVLLFGVMLWAWPESGLKDAAGKRTRLFVRQLPGALDVMRLISQSGGDLFSGIVAVTQVTEPGPVREELTLLRNEVAFGASLPAALNHVAERVGTPEATAVFTTLAQAMEMGTSISDNLRSAAELIRRQARNRAQERAQKAVVNMSFPLLLLILPGVFIVLLAPLVLQYLASR